MFDFHRRALPRTGSSQRELDLRDIGEKLRGIKGTDAKVVASNTVVIETSKSGSYVLYDTPGKDVNVPSILSPEYFKAFQRYAQRENMKAEMGFYNPKTRAYQVGGRVPRGWIQVILVSRS